MSDILAMPDPGNCPHPRRNGHRTTLLVEDLHPHDVQDSELTAELAGMLEGLLAAETAEAPTVPAEESLLPGFEALTWADLAEARRLGDQLHDQLDASEHRGVQHSILPAQGGASFGDHDPDASISIQLEHNPHQHHAPRIVLELRIDNIPHEAYLDPAEATALQHILTALLNETEN